MKTPEISREPERMRRRFEKPAVFRNGYPKIHLFAETRSLEFTGRAFDLPLFSRHAPGARSSNRAMKFPHKRINDGPPYSQFASHPRHHRHFHPRRRWLPVPRLHRVFHNIGWRTEPPCANPSSPGCEFVLRHPPGCNRIDPLRHPHHRPVIYRNRHQPRGPQAVATMYSPVTRISPSEAGASRMTMPLEMLSHTMASLRCAARRSPRSPT